MKEIDYPELPHHWRLQKDFDYTVFQYIRKLETGGIILNTESVAVVRDWLVNHILKENKKISQYQQGTAEKRETA